MKGLEAWLDGDRTLDGTPGSNILCYGDEAAPGAAAIGCGAAASSSGANELLLSLSGSWSAPPEVGAFQRKPIFLSDPLCQER